MARIRTEALAKEIARDCLAVRLRLVNRVVSSIYDEALRPLGLKVSQLNILVAVAHMRTARPAKVCRVLALDASTLSRNVDRMRLRGWLEVLAGEDARSRELRVTAKGRGILARALPPWREAQREAAERLGEDGVTLLRRTAASLGFSAG